MDALRLFIKLVGLHCVRKGPWAVEGPAHPGLTAGHVEPQAPLTCEMCLALLQCRPSDADVLLDAGDKSYENRWE